MAIVRELKTVDYKGRIFIPKAVLDDVGIKPGDKVYFETTKTGGVVVRKHEPKKVTDNGGI
jgi:AbrB family looped-hinge helix DNA binding protein